MDAQGQDSIALRPARAAAALGISRSQLYALIRCGQIRTFKLGAATLIARTDLETWVARQLGEAGNAWKRRRPGIYRGGCWRRAARNSPTTIISAMPRMGRGSHSGSVQSTGPLG
jgi:excisionase family DNA binding protein